MHDNASRTNQQTQTVQRGELCKNTTANDRMDTAARNGHCSLHHHAQTNTNWVNKQHKNGTWLEKSES